MPIIDSNNLEVLREKVDAWREVEQENLSRYCEVLDLLLKLADDVDGHPAQAIVLLGEVRDIITKIEQRVLGDNDRSVEQPALRWHQHPIFLVGMAMLAGAVASFLTLFLTN